MSVDLKVIHDVLAILQAAKAGRGGLPKAMTAYQVLEQHPDRDALIAKHGRPGRGSGSTFSAAQLLSRALMRLQQAGAVKFKYVYTAGMFFIVAGEPVIPGYEVCAFYQLTQQGAKAVMVEIRGGVIVLLDASGVMFSSGELEDKDDDEAAA